MASIDTQVAAVGVSGTAGAASTAAKKEKKPLSKEDLNYRSPIPAGMPYDEVQKYFVNNLLNTSKSYSDAVAQQNTFGWLAFASAGVTMYMLGIVATRTDISQDERQKAFVAAGIGATSFTVLYALHQSKESDADYILNKAAEKEFNSALALPTPEPTAAPTVN